MEILFRVGFLVELKLGVACKAVSGSVYTSKH